MEQPHNLEAEINIIAKCLMESDAIVDIQPLLKPDDLYNSKHRSIYKAICALSDKKIEITMATVYEELRGQIETLALSAIIKNYYPANAEQNIKLIKDNAYLRRCLQTFNKFTAKAKAKEYEDISGFKSEIEEEILSLNSDESGQIVSVKDLMSEVVDEIESVKTGQPTGIMTYINPLDNYLMGLQAGDFIILAARPSMGKTSLALQIGQENAIRGKKVFAVTLEMTAKQLLRRMLINHSNTSGVRVKLGNLDSNEWAKVCDSAGKLYKIPLYMDETAKTLPEIRARAKRIKAVNGLDLMIIDYVGLMSGPGKNREQEISGISRGLKGLAKELQIPIICLSQLNRDNEKRGNKRPALSDLRDSGSLEQDADIVMFIHRDDYYRENKRESDGIAEIIIAKQRNGPVGTVNLKMDPQTMRFYYSAVSNFGKEVKYQDD